MPMFNAKAGEWISYTGVLYTVRDATLVRLMNDDFSPQSGVPIYFCGPSFKGDLSIGACGPTTTARMEKFFSWLVSLGVPAIIGKGSISEDAINIIRGKTVYLLAVGGAGALYGSLIQSYEIVRYPELGPEALIRVNVKDMPLLVGVDRLGNTII